MPTTKTGKMRKIRKKIIQLLFGRVYYAVIIGETGSGDRYDIASKIHLSRASAEAHRRRIEQTRSFIYIETIKFRSRRVY